MDYAIQDTIVAVASPPGPANRAVLRLSGPEALPIASALFRADDGGSPAHAAGFSRLEGQVFLDTGYSLPAECYVFRAPRSYTRQDAAELHVIGSAPLLAMLTERAVERGARTAGPGEFTARAFLAGAMDLTQAEAVASVIAARSDAQLRAAQAAKEGDLAQKALSLADELTDLLSLVEADIDFSEEPIDFVSPAAIRDRLADLVGRMDALLKASSGTERLGTLPVVTLTGAANAGKSTLLNALTGLDRAICSATAGTTRDVLSAPMKLPGGEVLLQDTAGHQQVVDRVACLAREQARIAADRADLICLVVDVTAPSAAVPAPCPAEMTPTILIVANKIDLLDSHPLQFRLATLRETYGPVPVHAVSALSGAGLETLRQAIDQRLSHPEQNAAHQAVAMNARQRHAFQTCRRALGRASRLTDRAAKTIDCAELVALEIREALDALGQVTGQVTTEDLLSRIFGNFCIGK